MFCKGKNNHWFIEGFHGKIPVFLWFGILLSLPGAVLGTASAAAPILVNTEAFQTIDDDDVSSDLAIQFGASLGKSITYQRDLARFQFNDDVYVSGNLQASGTLSGQDLHISGNGSDSLMSTDAALGRVGVGTDTPKSTLNVIGTMSGRRLNLTSLVATRTGALFVNQRANSTGATIRSISTIGTPVLVLDGLGSTTTSPHILFGTNKVFDTTLFRSAVNTLSTGGNFSIFGTLSGASVTGFGLGSCSNPTTSKLLYDNVTGHFSCGTDQTGGGSTGGGGMSQTDGDARYVKKEGDTMTGALEIRSTAGTTSVNLNVAGTLSGRSILISGTGGVRHPLIMTDPTTGAVGFGTNIPDDGGVATFSGATVFMSQPDPPVPGANSLMVYAKKVSGRMLLKAKGPSGVDYPYQPSFFQNQICMLSAGASTTINSVGCSATNDTTLSTPAVTETYGFMTNFATAATAGDNAGTSSNIASFFRGSTTGANGFFYYARIGVVDTADIRLFSGLANQTIAVMTDADNPAGHYAGFQYSTGRGDSNWQFITKDNSTQSVTDTGLPVSAAKVYDTYFYCTPQCTSMYWRVDNITDNTTAEGSTSSNLPGGSTAMRGVVGVGAIVATAKNVRMQRMYIESDR